jgi:catechol 2,3-dioxygenase-like lactoylglutathione lyase family enzyme
MLYVAVTHVALQVSDLREAERYYTELLDLEVAWRDSDGKASLFATWDEIDAAGAVPVVVMVYRDNLRIALAEPETEAYTQTGRIGHFGLQVSPEQLKTVRERARRLGLRVTGERDDELFVFTDAYGVQWELDTRSFADPIAIGRAVEERQQTTPST